MSSARPMLRLEDLAVDYRLRHGRTLHAVCGVSLTLERGETLGLVGESGCGKSSLGRAVMLLPPPTSGRVILDGTDLTTLPSRALRSQRKRFQMVFQDPVGSLNPAHCAGETIEVPLKAMGLASPRERRRLAQEMMVAVGLDPDRHYSRRPQQLSGGQCQRISIARALVNRPDLLVCDEPVSALDVSVQAQILNLLREMKESLGLSMLLIAHDLAVVQSVSDRVAVMYLGRLCEVGPCRAIYGEPAHPYTAALLAAVPRPDPLYPMPDLPLRKGELPSPIDPPSGCRFRTRCPRADTICASIQPPMEERAPGHWVACHHPCR